MFSSHINNQDLFYTSMTVMAICNEKSKEDIDFSFRVKDWSIKNEYTAIAYDIYKKLHCGFIESSVRILLEDYLLKDETRILPLPESISDKTDCYFGLVCGDFLGYPDVDKLDVIKDALEEFYLDSTSTDLKDIFRNHPEWIN